MKTSSPLLFFVDLEGVLAPEMWPFLAERLALTELRETTREVPDYVALMDKRIAALRKNNVGIDTICRELRKLNPLPGAVDFIRALKDRGTVVLVSDSFEPMNMDIVRHFQFDQVICHRFKIDAGGLILGCEPWNDFAGKHCCYSLFASMKYEFFAVGDALNDLEMLRRATKGILYRPSSVTLSSAPDICVAMEYDEVLAEFDKSLDPSLETLS